MFKDPHRYDDMLFLSRPRSGAHPPMSIENRAAQFSPFAALVGYEDQVAEEARLTHRKHILSEIEKQVLDEKLRMLSDHMHDEPRPTVKVTYFQPDALKAGGSYLEQAGSVKKIDLTAQALIFFPETLDKPAPVIPIDDVLDMESPLFDSIDFF